MGDGLRYMKTAAIAIMVLAVVSLISMAIIGAFKGLTIATGYSNVTNTTIYTELVPNATADKFIAGIAYFGTFVGIIVLAIVGKILVGMFKGRKEL